MKKLKMQTENKVDENVEKIGEIFPNCITETIDADGKVIKVVDFDLLKQELSSFAVEGADERYQFNWADKKKSILLANSPINKTLRPYREESVNFDTTQNLYIEGDNLDILKLLQETYMGKVKMIYIDPPYNTGKDFVYEDNFAISTEEYLERSGMEDEDGNRLFQNNDSNGRFHTDWLNMMYPRLKLARDLLTDDGVIFISIDENEVYNMQKMCNEVFGEENYAATFLWTKTSTPPALSYKCRKTVEYVLAYERIKNTYKYFGDFLENGDAPLLNTGNPEKTLIFPKGSVRFTYMDTGEIAAGKKDKVDLVDNIKIEKGVNSNVFKLTGEFKWGQDMLDNEVSTGTYFVVKTDKFSIRFQRVANADAYKTPTNLMNIELNAQTKVGTNESAVKELENLGLEGVFDYPKPISLLETLCSIICKFDKNAIVLDFFSGSATTAHAVMQLNAEDGGNRKFIMVQLPEVTDEKSEAYKAGYKNICEIGKERIRRAGNKIIEDNNKSKEPKDLSNLDIGFRVLKTDSSNMKPVFYNPNETTQDLFSKVEDNIKDDRTAEDLLFQVMLDMGIELSSDITVETIGNKTVYTVGGDNLICCFDTDITKDTITEIAKRKPLYAIFRDSGFERDDTLVSFDQIFATYSSTTERRVL